MYLVDCADHERLLEAKIELDVSLLFLINIINGFVYDQLFTNQYLTMNSSKLSEKRYKAVRPMKVLYLCLTLQKNITALTSVH